MKDTSTGIYGFLSGNRSEAMALVRDLGLTVKGVEHFGAAGKHDIREDRYGRAERAS